MNAALPVRIDWFRVLADLAREGYSLEKVSYFTEIPRTTLIEYRQGAEPPYWRGEILMKFWRESTRLDSPPLTPIYPSAHSRRGQ
jgi:hypothetical protein